MAESTVFAPDERPAALVRLPVTIAGMDEHFAAYNAYREDMVERSGS